MFEFLENATKAVVGAVVETPISLIADTITLGGSLTDKEVPYTYEALSKVMNNVEKITK
jgi:hypothetical protein